MDGYSPLKLRRFGADRQTPVFFLHIPKTAGTAVRHLLEASLPPGEIHRVEDARAEARLRSFAPLESAIRFASGHMPYWYRDAFAERARLLVFLRHPVERVLSTYRFWRNLPAPSESDESAEAALLRATQSTSVEDFVSDPSGLWWGAIANYATWLLGHASPWNLEAPANELTPRLARSRLANAEMIGVCERLNDSLQLITREFGVPLTRSPPAANVSADHAGTDRASRAVTQAILDANEHDLMLWEFANKELDRRQRASTLSVHTVRLPPLARERLLPQLSARGMELKPGEDAIIGEGWLPPEHQDASSWRFAASPGPACLHVQWPVYDADYCLLIDSPFAANSFDYSDLSISVDGKAVEHTCVQLLNGVVIVTRPIPAGRNATRAITFDYPNEVATAHSAKRTHEKQIAFAVSSIRWMPCPEGDWNVAHEVAALAGAMGARARANAQGLSKLEAMIAKKDEYIASLTRALNEKDAYTLSLQNALAAKMRELDDRTRGGEEASLTTQVA